MFIFLQVCLIRIRLAQVNRLRKRLGTLVFFPWIQPEQAGDRLIYEELSIPPEFWTDFKKKGVGLCRGFTTKIQAGIMIARKWDFQQAMEMGCHFYPCSLGSLVKCCSETQSWCIEFPGNWKKLQRKKAATRCHNRIRVIDFFGIFWLPSEDRKPVGSPSWST